MMRDILYELKKDFGVKGALYKIASNSNDLGTGVKTLTKTKYSINKIIVLPKSYITAKIYSLSYIAANKNFTYGAYFNKDTKVFLIEKRDINNVDIKPEDYLIIEHERFEIKELQEAELNLAYIVIANKVDGQFNGEIHDLNVIQKMRLAQWGSYEY